jgi:histidyl-tRNA synthetase
VWQDELAQGQAKLKEMGLPDEHPLKEGELISLDNLVEEVKARLARKEQLDRIAAQAEGLRVVDGIKGEAVVAAAAAAKEVQQPEEEEPKAKEEVKLVSALAAQAAE